MENLIVRKIIQADNVLLAKLIRNVFNEFDAPQKGTVYSDPTTDDLYTLFQKHRAVLWVAEVNNEVLGCCGGCRLSLFPQLHPFSPVIRGIEFPGLARKVCTAGNILVTQAV